LRLSAASTFCQSMPWAFAAVAIVAVAKIAMKSFAARMLVLLGWRYGVLGFLPRVLCKCSKEPIDCLPKDDMHECVDVTCRFGTEVDVVRVLVHVEHQDRRGPP